MIALLLTFAVFVALWIVGVATLVAARADTTTPRVVLTAPVLGSAVLVLSLFLASEAGAPLDTAAPPIVAAVLAAAIGTLAVRRPRLPAAVLPVAGIAIAALFLAGRPMLTFGFDWIANANDDMANYVLAAAQLLHHPVLTPFDVTGIRHSRDYATFLQALHNDGARPGAETGLAALSAVTGRLPYEVFMPFIFALHLCTVCAAASLALQAARRQWAAYVAAGLVAVSPLATYGVLQQLLPQVWGLGLAAALLALIARLELHQRPGPRANDVALVGLLAAALVLVYVELGATLVVAYVLYVVVLSIRRELDLRVAVRLWVPGIAIVLITLNAYLTREVRYVAGQAGSGIDTSGAVPLFGYSLVPSALPAILGLQSLAAGDTARYLQLSIVIAVPILAAVFAAAVVQGRRGGAAASALLAYAAFGVLLAAHSSDFGLFKLYMYIQPFLAAVVAVWISWLHSKAAVTAAISAIALLAIPMIANQAHYVARSRNPIDLRYASAPDLLPAFRHIFDNTHVPVISVTDNPTLAKLEAASVGDSPLYFMSIDPVTGFLPAKLRSLTGWRKRSFDLREPDSRSANTFNENVRSTALIGRGRCALIVPTGSQSVINRRWLPEGLPDITSQNCRDAKDLLVFTESSRGSGFYSFKKRQNISFFQLQKDPIYRGRTMSGFGRYILLRVLGGTPSARLELSLTKSLIHDGENRLPGVAVVGTARERLPIVGRGSARVFSPPITPQVIDGQSYIMLDMGSRAQLLPQKRSGIENLYGHGIPVDSRFLTSYVRNLSLVPASTYRTLAAPTAVRHFPADLDNPNLEYSGIYEDGWVAQKSYVVLAGGAPTDVVVRADPLPISGQKLDVFVNGRRVASRSFKDGAGSPLNLAVPVPGSPMRRRIELRWEKVAQLQAPDLRPAAARLSFIGLAKPSATFRPSSPLESPGVEYSGIYADGWSEQSASVVLAGGRAANLVIRAQVAMEGQHLTVVVDGKEVGSTDVKRGIVNLRFPIPISDEPRLIRLRWSTVGQVASGDPRRAAALLEFMSVRSG